MQFKSILASAVMGGALVVGAYGGAQAAPLDSFFQAGENLLDDDSQEWFVTYDDNGNQIVLDTTSEYADTSLLELSQTLENGLYIRGVFEIDTVNGEQLISGVDSELTGIFELRLNWNGFAYELTASEYFADEALGWGYTNVEGATVAFFEGSGATNNLDIEYNPEDFPQPSDDTTIVEYEADATDGDAFWLAGLDGEDDFWSAFIANPIVTINQLYASQGDAVQVGFYNLAVSLLEAGTGPELAEFDCGALLGNPMAHFCGNGGLDAAVVDGIEAASSNDIDLRVLIVPEPATLGLFGLGLLGVAGYARARRKAA
ncbi:MAG: PEP-CTERM sorting domain-containing protein [Magnetospiraceae bacterium]